MRYITTIALCSIRFMPNTTHYQLQQEPKTPSSDLQTELRLSLNPEETDRASFLPPVSIFPACSKHTAYEDAHLHFKGRIHVQEPYEWRKVL